MVGVHPDRAGDGRIRAALAEQIAGRLGCGSQDDAGDDVAAVRQTAGRAGRVETVVIAIRLGLRDRIGAARQIGEAIGSIRPRDDRAGDAFAARIRSRQRQGDAADYRLVRVVDAVVVGVVVGQTRQRPCPLAEVDGGRRLVGADGHRHAIGGVFRSLAVTFRLNLDHDVVAAANVAEAVGAVRARGRRGHQFARRLAQFDHHAFQRTVPRPVGAVQVHVHIDRAVQPLPPLAEGVVGRVHARRKDDVVDTIAVDLDQTADRARAIATVGEAFRLGLRQLVVSS